MFVHGKISCGVLFKCYSVINQDVYLAHIKFINTLIKSFMGGGVA